MRALHIFLALCLILPGLVVAEEVKKIEIRQDYITGGFYVDNVTDFRTLLSSSFEPFGHGIYSGPILPGVVVRFHRQAPALQLSATISLPSDEFLYGAVDWVIYFPVLTEAYRIRVDIYDPTVDKTYGLMEPLEFDASGYELSGDGIDFNTLVEAGYAQYEPSLGYFIRIPTYPLRSATEYTIRATFQFRTAVNAEMLIAQENISILQDYTLRWGDASHISESVYFTFRTIDTATADDLPPPAVAFTMLRGLSSALLGGATLPGTSIIKDYGVSDGSYSTIFVPVRSAVPITFTVHDYYQDSTGATVHEWRNITTSRLIIQSTDTLPPSGKVVFWEITPQNRYDNFTIIINANSVQNQEFRITRGDGVEDRGDVWAKYLQFEVKNTADRYVYVGDTYKISDDTYSSLSLQNAINVIIKDARSNVVINSFISTARGIYDFFTDTVDVAKEEVQSRSEYRDMSNIQLNLMTLLNMDELDLEQICEIVYAALLEFVDYLIKDLLPFWDDLAPALQALAATGGVLVFMIIVVYGGRALYKNIRDEEVRE